MIGSSQSIAPIQTLSVCEVILGDPTRLNGKIIRVAGYLRATDHGMWLGGKCSSQLQTKGLVWVNNISIYVSSDPRIARSWDSLDKQVKRLHADPESENIKVVIVGRLETRATMEDMVVQMPYGLSRAGFGHMGDAPARIDFISVDGVSLERETSPR